MEGLKHLSLAAFRSQKFHSAAGAKYDSYEIRTFADQTVESLFGQEFVPEKSLAHWFGKPAADGAEATLRITCISRAFDVTLGISREAFTDVFATMNADPGVLYMLCRDYDGFHEYHGKGYALTRFVGTPLYALLWTFDFKTCTTRCMFFHRLWDPYRPFTEFLRVYKEHIYTPQLLSFVSVLYQLHWFDSQTSTKELAVIRDIESHTGFASYLVAIENLGLKKFDINELTVWSQRVGEVAGNMSNRLRHQKNSRVMLEAIMNERDRIDSTNNPLVISFSRDMALKYRHSTVTLAEAIPSVEKHMFIYDEFLAYLKDRSERLSGVLFALLTHEDANASVTLAYESKKDSSSMKTVAVVTMAFLPATFYAALFAIPSLQWGEPQVIGEKFWIYWAFTLPSTLLVFILWLGITQREWMREVARAWAKGVK